MRKKIMSIRFKAPKLLTKAARRSPDTSWDPEFSPLMLLFHHNDPARAGRILIMERGDRRIVRETPETLASFMDFISGGASHDPNNGVALSHAIKIRLPWAAALAFLRRADWKDIAAEKRVEAGFN